MQYIRTGSPPALPSQRDAPILLVPRAGLVLQMSLSKVSKVIVQICPWTEAGATSARELLARLNSARIGSKNPDCKILGRLRVSGPSLVEVEYEDKSKKVITTAGKTAPQILSSIQAHTQDGNTRELLKKAGLEGTQLETRWCSTAQRHDPGLPQKVPIV